MSSSKKKNIYIYRGLFQNLWESPFAYILVLVVTHNSKNSNDHMHPYLIFPLNFISMEMWIPWKQLVIYNYRSFSQLRNIYWIFNKVIKIPSFNTSLKKNKNYNSFDVNPFMFVLPPLLPPFFFGNKLTTKDTHKLIIFPFWVLMEQFFFFGGEGEMRDILCYILTFFFLVLSVFHMYNINAIL